MRRNFKGDRKRGNAKRKIISIHASTLDRNLADGGTTTPSSVPVATNERCQASGRKTRDSVELHPHEQHVRHSTYGQPEATC